MKGKSCVLILLITLYLLIGSCLFALIENEPLIYQTSLASHTHQENQISETEAYTGGKPIGNFTIYTVDPSGDKTQESVAVRGPFGDRLIYWFNYCVSLLTTIGYGDVYPMTAGGKAFTICYGLIGIPFTYLCLVKLGLMFRYFTRVLLSKVAKRLGALQSLFKRHGYFPVELPLHSTLFVCFMYLVPAAIFHSVEDWSYGDSIYFCFVSLSTVGFGDLIANQGHLGFSRRKIIIYKILTKAWIFSGLVWQFCILSIFWSKLHSVPGFRAFIQDPHSENLVVEDIPMTEKQKSLANTPEDEEHSLGEEERMNTSREKDKLNA